MHLKQYRKLLTDVLPRSAQNYLEGMKIPFYLRKHSGLIIVFAGKDDKESKYNSNYRAGPYFEVQISHIRYLNLCISRARHILKEDVTL